MTGDPANAAAVDLLRMAQHQREAGRKCLALAIGTGDTALHSSLLEMAFEYESRATKFENDARGVSDTGDA